MLSAKHFSDFQLKYENVLWYKITQNIIGKHHHNFLKVKTLHLETIQTDFRVFGVQ